MDIAQAAYAAFRQQGFFAVMGEVGDDFAAVDVGDHRADRHAQHDIFCALAVAVRAASGFAVLGAMYAGEAIVHQRIDVAIRQRIHAPAASAIAAVRPALLDVFFAAKTGRAVAALTREYFDFRFVYEFHESNRASRNRNVGRAMPDMVGKAHPTMQIKKPYLAIGLVLFRRALI